MQGRLLAPRDGRIQAFPSDAWEQELVLARDATIDGIEWIFETYGEDENPLADDAGLARLLKAENETGTKVTSLCADWFMDRPLVQGDEWERSERRGKLGWLVHRAQAAGIRRIVVPFVDHAALTTADDAARAAETIASLTPELERTGVEVHLETSLGPDAFAALLARIPHRLVKANYDTGNSAALGYDAEEEFDAYGTRIGSVHVKDRVRGGGTVALGQGAADLTAVFRRLRDAGWTRPLVLQVARGEPGGEVEKTRRDADMVRALWNDAG